jgi:hypothetical protein
VVGSSGSVIVVVAISSEEFDVCFAGGIYRSTMNPSEPLAFPFKYIILVSTRRSERRGRGIFMQYDGSGSSWLCSQRETWHAVEVYPSCRVPSLVPSCETAKVRNTVLGEYNDCVMRL